MKVIGIVRNNCITGVEYGLIEVADPKGTKQQKKNKKDNTKKIKNKKSRCSVKNTRIKTAHIEKETKSTQKKQKRKYHIHITIACSYNLKTSQKPVDLSKKRFRKAKDLFKKKQRKEKIALQNVMQHVTDAVLSDLMAVERNKQR